MQTQAYFEDIPYHIKRELNQAKKSICIAVPWFTELDLFDLLCKKSKQKIQVELIVLDDKVNNTSGIDFNQLIKSKGHVWKIRNNKNDGLLLQNKFCLIDATIIINGSYNWSHMARDKFETITIISDVPDLAGKYQQEFNSIKEQYLGLEPDNLVLDYAKLWMRLEALRSMILLEDKDDIKLQLRKIKKTIKPHASEEPVEQVYSIIKMIEEHSYSAAITHIDDFISRFKGLTVYVDPEIIALKLEAKALEIQISSLEDEKAEIEKLIHDFELSFNQELGELILKLLELRKERLKEEVEEDESRRAEFENAEKEYEDFQNNYEISKNEEKFELTPEQLQELKSNFRKASKLCHPDVVAKEYKEEAEEIFKELNNAYVKNDLQKVNEILAYLEQGIFKSNAEKVTEKDKLKIIIKKLRIKLTTLEQRINQLKQSETYETISEITDWKVYFQGIREQLLSEIHQLEANG